MDKTAIHPSLSSAPALLDRPRGRFLGLLIGALILLCLAGCNREELYQVDNEGTANAMVSLLLSEGIPTRKVKVSDGVWSVEVDKQLFPQAVNILDYYGIPQKTFPGVEEFYGKKGLVSSPEEERARYMHALSQDIASTLLLINGVIDARVHVVLPENDPFSGTSDSASAAVFLKHRQFAQVENMIPDIKHMVSKSVEGLSYENVSVSLFPTIEWENVDVDVFRNRIRVLGIEVYPESLESLQLFLLINVSINVLFAFLCIYLVWRLRRVSKKLKDNKKPNQAEPQPDPTTAPA